MTKKCSVDLTNKVFGRLTVLNFIPDDSKYSKFLCLCKCGIQKLQYSFDLTSGNAKSCGCLHKDLTSKRFKKHGQSGSNNKLRTRTYRSWASMMDRCHWGGNKIMFLAYGAKGKTVCKRWHTFENFYADMGDRPENTSIDRINNDGNYQLNNCRWADKITQARNTSKTIKVKINNEIVILKTYCELNSLNYKAIRARASRRNNDYVKALQSIGINANYDQG
jgi:hypothetical protein